MIFDFLRIRSDVLNSRDCCRVDADVCFADGLVREVRDKIHADITLILEQKSTMEADALFWLTLNETLEFDRAMRRQLSVNAEDLHGAVGVFTDNPKLLQRWISLEVKCTSGHVFASQRESSSHPKLCLRLCGPLEGGDAIQLCLDKVSDGDITRGRRRPRAQEFPHSIYDSDHCARPSEGNKKPKRQTLLC
jgi:hypothetical protein